MAILSSLRSRRSTVHQTEATQTFIAFRLRREWFALPIDVVQKVALLGQVYGDPQGMGISLTSYQDRELLVLDVGQRIFGESSSVAPAANSEGAAHQRYLLVLQAPAKDWVGLPIDSAPVIRRVPQSAFTPIPDAYLAAGNIHCLSSMMVQLPQQPLLFLLNPETLMASAFLAPGIDKIEEAIAIDADLTPIAHDALAETSRFDLDP